MLIASSFRLASKVLPFPGSSSNPYHRLPFLFLCQPVTASNNKSKVIVVSIKMRILHKNHLMPPIWAIFFDRVTAELHKMIRLSWGGFQPSLRDWSQFLTYPALRAGLLSAVPIGTEFGNEVLT
jgi:hypothetical protein